MIIYIHSETDQTHTYNLRSRGVFFASLFALFLPLILLVIILTSIGDVPSSSPLAILDYVLWVVIWGIYLIDTAPMYLRQYFAGIRGKMITTSGSMLGGGTPRIVIQK